MNGDRRTPQAETTLHTLAGGSDFPTTRWTLVIAAIDSRRTEARSALVSLCEGYWYPLYAYVRRRGYPADQAQDLTQEFFIRVMEGRYLDRADPEKGRFRAFILTSLKFFLADEADRSRAQKRGGGKVLSFEVSSGEDRYQREPAHNETPERIFERRWALSVLDRVVDRLRSEFVQHGRLDHFNRLKAFLLDQADAPYAALAREMGTIGRRAQGRDSSAPEALSRALPAGDCGDGGRCERGRIRTPLSRGRADAQVVAQRATRELLPVRSGFVRCMRLLAGA